MVGFTKEAREAASKSFAVNAKIRKQQKIDEYLVNPNFCENDNCKKVLSFEQAKGKTRFCCRSCSNVVVKRLASDESRQKVSAKLTGINRNKSERPKQEKVCPVCKQNFFISYSKRNQKTCSFQCGKYLGARNAAKTKTANGTHSGWHNRRMEPSYPEKYFISLFENEGIFGWEREVKIGKWFIDFAFADLKLAVEIDGRQHEDSDRKATDEKKDLFLKNLGWKVIRIQWRNPSTERGRNFLYPQIESLKTIFANK